MGFWNWEIFLLGAAGAAAPIIITLYSDPHILRYWRSDDLIAMLLYLLLGGVVAVLLQASAIWSAFLTGASVNLIIASIRARKEIKK